MLTKKMKEALKLLQKHTDPDRPGHEHGVLSHGGTAVVNDVVRVAKNTAMELQRDGLVEIDATATRAYPWVMLTEKGRDYLP